MKEKIETFTASALAVAVVVSPIIAIIEYVKNLILLIL